MNSLIYNIFGRQHRKDIDHNINNYIFHTKQNVQFITSNKYLLLLLYIHYWHA